MGYGLDERGSIPGRAKFSFFHSVQTGSRVIQRPIQWLPGAISPGLKRQGREGDHLTPSSAEVKNDGAIPLLPHMP
jgi:hypothetical protein